MEVLKIQESAGKIDPSYEDELNIETTIRKYYANVPEDILEIPDVQELTSWIPQLYPHGNPSMDVDRGIHAYHRHTLLDKDIQLKLGKLMDYGRVANSMLLTGNSQYVKEEMKAVLRLSAEARDTLILSHVSLVKNLAYKAYANFKPKTLTIEDLEDEGIFGLTYATYKFDWRRGRKFTTYGTWWARQSIQRAIPMQDHVMRTPIYRFSVASKLLRRTSAEDRKNRDIASLALQSGLSSKKVESTLRYLDQLHVLELDAPIQRRVESDNTTTLADVIKDKRDPGYEDVGAEERMEALKDYLFEVLSMREYRVLCHRGDLLDTDHTLTLEEIGDLFGLTRQRINQINKDMRARLAHPQRKKRILQIVGEED